MSEIEKMYIRCKIKKQQTCSRSDTCYNGSLNECEGCNAYQYPEFTAEKQLELICFIVKSKERISFTNKPYILTRDVLANGLAFAINNLWQDLTDTEKAEIKRILE